MKKILGLITILFGLSSCAESLALLGPASTSIGGGNVVQSTLTSAFSYGVKKQTGKTPIEHAMDYVEKNNPDDEKKPCVSFLENTTSETCAVIKRRLAELRKSIEVKSKIKSLD
tara:strand:+ start:147 stop:488 length:342 start_codon:yes stop_codon:yes gene_type:complete